MPEGKITTANLLKRLFKTGNIVRFIRNHEAEMRGVPFRDHLARLCEEKNKVPNQVISRSGIDRTYGHQLFNGRRKPSRDKVLQLAFGFELTYEEAQDLLKSAGESPLYPRIQRDAVIIFALIRGLDVDDVQATLLELSLPLFKKDEKSVQVLR